MINLLPDEHKAEIRAGRTNVILVRYIALLVTAAVVLGGLVAGSYVALNGTKSSAELKVAENQERVATYQSIKSRADSFRSELSTAKTIFDSSPSFTKLIYDIANTVPRNVVLDGLTLDPATFGTSTTISASAKSVSDATRLRDAFIKNDRVFSDVHLLSIKSPDSATSTDAYPVKISMSVVINKGAMQ